ncbi:hypothetical protein FCN51_16145 (plasmid) [Acetobacter pasteurianus]|nr:hypothetical protein FCN51_16145 [Acetobacter pasteurianus]
MSGRYPTTGRSTRSSRASEIPTVFTSSEELRKYFPKSFLRNGSLNLSGKKRIQYLPDEITVNGDYISLSNCTSLLRVPNGLDRTCSISLDGCTSLREIPEYLSEFSGIIDLTGCTALEYLPEGMHIKGSGSLILDGCTSLKHLPEGLQVEGRLSIKGCTGLVDLPKGMEVGFMDMDGCTSIKRLPSDLKIHMSLVMDGCDGIAIPQSFLDNHEGKRGIRLPENYHVVEADACSQPEFSL